MKQTKLLFLLIATLATTLTATAQPMEQREQSDAYITSAESRQRKTENQIKVEVSETIELMSILARTAGNREYNMDMAGQYTKDTEAWFAPYKQHAAVSYFQSLHNQYGISYDAVMSMAIHLDINGGRIKLLGEQSDLERRWKDIDIEDFINKLNTFYTDTRFHDFYEQHRTFYEEGLKAYETNVMIYFHQDWYARFYGTAPTDRFRIVIGFTIGGGNYGPCRQLPGQPREAYAICGYYINPQTGKPYGEGADMAATLIHEFNHSFVNPLLNNEANASMIAATGQKLRKFSAYAMERQAYSDWQTVINESIVRAAVILYMLDQGFDQKQVLNELANQVCRSFNWMPELVTSLRYYAANRGQYPTLNDYYPEIAKCLEKYLKAEIERIEKAL
jgi:hypothetical protein